MQDIRSYIGKAYGSYEEKLPDIKVSKGRVLNYEYSELFHKAI